MIHVFFFKKNNNQTKNETKTWFFFDNFPLVHKYWRQIVWCLSWKSCSCNSNKWQYSKFCSSSKYLFYFILFWKKNFTIHDQTKIKYIYIYSVLNFFLNHTSLFKKVFFDFLVVLEQLQNWEINLIKWEIVMI